MRLAYMPDTHFGQYGQSIPERDEVSEAAEHLLKEAELAEEVGFDGVWIPERHARTETFFPSPVSLATAIAARTTEITIACTVIQPTYYNPVHLAEKLALVDQLSKGRFILGAGVGYHEDYFDLFNYDYETRGDRFEEALEVIEGVWTQETFSYDGEFFEFDDVTLTPKPYQDPRPPIWIGAFEDVAIQRSSDWDGWVLWFPPEVDELADMEDKWRQRAEEHGQENWTFGVAYEGWIGDDEEALRERHAGRWVREAGFYEEEELGTTYESIKEEAREEIEDMWLTLGPADKWIDRLEEVERKVDPDWVVIRTITPKPEDDLLSAEEEYVTNEERLEQIQRFGEEVIRPFQKRS